VDEVLGELDAKVSPDRPGGSIAGVRGSHHGSHDLPRVLGSFDHREHRRAASDEVDKASKEGLSRVFGVVLFCSCAIDRAQFRTHQRKAPTLETSEDLPDEPSLNSVGFADDEGTVGHSGVEDSRHQTRFGQAPLGPQPD
jgi:hypothetical protein